jgi:outer membrane protein
MRPKLSLQKLVVAVGIALSACASAHAQERLTLAQAAARVLENNPELAIDGPGQQAARADFKATRAGYLPRLDFEQSYLAGNNPVFVFGTLLTQRRFTAAHFALPSLNNPDAIDNIQSRVALQQNIWDFGRTHDRREEARLGVDAVDRSHADHVRQVLLGVYQAYYSASLARESLATARVALQSAEAIAAQAKSRVEHGLAVEADLLRSRVYLSEARQQVIQAQGQSDIARVQLNRLMGEALDAPSLETAPLEPKVLPLPAEETLVSEQRRQRPDYQRLLTELQQAETAVRSKQKDFLPTLSGFTGWEADNPSVHQYGGNNWTAGVTLRWNVFAGGADAAQLEASRLRVDQKRKQIAAMESAMALELRKALVECRAAQEQVTAAQAAEAEAQEGLRILRNRYDAGLATMTDLLSAETARSSARTALAGAIYKYKVSFAQVEHAAGVLSPTSPAFTLQ